MNKGMKERHRKMKGRKRERKEETAGEVKTREKQRSSPLSKKPSEVPGSRSQEAGIKLGSVT